jgi:hypothetical protein
MKIKNKCVLISINIKKLGKKKGTYLQRFQNVAKLYRDSFKTVAISIYYALKKTCKDGS